MLAILMLSIIRNCFKTVAVIKFSIRALRRQSVSATNLNFAYRDVSTLLKLSPM